ncbi:MAG: hypothetical protein KIT54_10735 [Phycisphaeraceae bacterium]|nr:hypothetical protein [Phycisphaeraceae bacterium]
MFSAMDPISDAKQTVAPSMDGRDADRPNQDREPSEADRRKLEKLRETDQRVRRHEEAHRAAAGALHRGGPTYTYETGPDGKRYAVAGSVQIDTSPGRTPQETVQKAAQIRRTALAPVDPSSEDRAIAAKASRMEDAARRAMAREAMQKIDRKTAEHTSPPESAGQRLPTAPDAMPHTLDAVGEVWSDVSALNADQLPRHDLDANRSPQTGSGLDVLA